MSPSATLSMNRRESLRLGALLSLGLWPGRLRAAGNGRGEKFSFIAINDAHYQSPRCGEWFARVTASIRALPTKPEFCLMVGDLAEHGTKSELGAMRDVLRGLQMPFHAVIGNHDYAGRNDRSAWDALLPGSLNYHFEHRGWRFIGLDTSEGANARNTRVQSATLRWLDDTLPKLDRAKPTAVFTHFPLGGFVPMRPLNADELLQRFKEFNLTAVFNGHYHGLSERTYARATVTTNRCCAISRGNHDGSKEKGYFLCTADEGQIVREFIEVKTA